MKAVNYRDLPRLRTRRRGFSFTEVLFAVMILGVGFIMVAAIFPVAIQQAQTSTEETTAAAVSRGAVNYVEKVASNSTMPATNNQLVGPDFDGFAPYFTAPPGDGVDSDGRTLSTALRGSVVSASDSRYGWVPFYRRAGDPADPTTWAPSAQLVMIPVLTRNESQYNTLGGPPNAPISRGGPAVLQSKTRGGPRPPGTAVIIGDMVDGTAGAPDTVVFEADVNVNVPSEGAFIIIADASAMNTGGRVISPHLNGRIFRLGNRVEGTVTGWELMPGFDLEPIRLDLDGIPATTAPRVPPTPIRDGKEVVAGGTGPGGVPMNDIYFFVVGRGLDQSVGNGIERSGTAQDVAAYSTFINVN